MNFGIPAEVCLRANAVLPERDGGMLVGGQRDCLVVQEKEQVPRKVNGYSGVVQMAEVAVSHQ
jgi:hypothetical protein